MGHMYIFSQMVKKQRATKNPKNNNDDKYFQYSLTIALYHKQIKKGPQRILKIKPFVDQYNWKNLDFIKLIGKSLNQITSQLLLISYSYHI